MTKVLLYVQPSLGPDQEREQRRPIGRDNDAYQLMLDGLVELARAADDLGYWGLSYGESHLHSEGLVVSPAPLMLNVHLAQYTERLHHGQLGLVLPAHDPVRLAAEIAVADHMLKGRFFVGVARGNESRWTNILCQKMGVTATTSDVGEADERNRFLFSEHFRVMKMAWERDLLAYDGPAYKVPYPFEGIADWPLGETITATFGVPGEVDEHGAVKGVSVVPRPYSAPHPKIFHAFDASEATTRWCGQHDVVPTLVGSSARVAEHVRIHAGAREASGGSGPSGSGVAVCRTFHLIENGGGADAARSELLRRAERFEKPLWADWFGPLGLTAAMLADPYEDTPAPAGHDGIGQRLLDSGMLIGGTVDMVKRDLEAFLDQIPVEYLVWLLPWGMPRDDALRALELFATDVMPEFDLEAPSAPAEV